ncbi:MAG: P-II family nitrogen regulator [Candidatus Bathyarchaeia archaeon]|nr:P-II family nitrogen regulator [Candidatus Bathyarchaeia archaeon]
MKKIEAIIKPVMFSAVRVALAKAGYPSLTAYDVKGRSKQSGIIETVTGKMIRAYVLPKTKVEIIVEDMDGQRSHRCNSGNSLYRHDRRRKNLRLHS